MKNNFLLLMLTLITCKNYAQNDLNKINGKWHCIKDESIVPTKYNKKQLEQIKSSDLIIENDKFYFEGIKFIDVCSDLNWEITKYDTTQYYADQIEADYDNKELSEILVIEPKAKPGKEECYNNCVQLFLKQDTLINICGGYTLFFIKEKK
jgi:hypothetical protein